jgi:hypothetical protein
MPFTNLKFLVALFALAISSAVSASSEQPGLPGPGQYRIDFVYTGHTVGSDLKITARRSNFSTVQDAGKKASLNPSTDSGNGCQFITTITPTAEDQVLLDMPITCDGHTVNAKLATKIGQLTSFETTEGTAPGTQTIHNITFMVTR